MKSLGFKPRLFYFGGDNGADFPHALGFLKSNLQIKKKYVIIK
jgi:hypothetical protein